MRFNLSFPCLRILTFHADFPCQRIGRKLVGLPLRNLLRSWILHVDVLYVVDILRHVNCFWVNIDDLRMLVVCYE